MGVSSLAYPTRPLSTSRAALTVAKKKSAHQRALFVSCLKKAVFAFFLLVTCRCFFISAFFSRLAPQPLMR
jgi:hypothetical protein